ncbi:unnamed protein product, partial [Mesorhabditis belari]|uniref:ABC-type antigen peptide transporter n=1 Tax=Mesorhabditis belari TaxID=2138241 RepID=A0AAF3FH89_9BILA
MATTTARLAVGVLLSVLDISVSVLSTCLHSGPLAFDTLIDQIAHYNPFTSSADFLILTLFRTFFFYIPSCLAYGGRNSGLSTWHSVVSSACILMYAASPTKLLLLSEPLKEGEALSFGDILAIVWSFVGTFILDVAWRAYFAHTPSSYVVLDEEDENGELPPKQTFELILRLLQYCKREWLWHLSGFTFLFIYSVTRIFIPYYTGQVIATVVETSSYDNLHQAVYTMTMITLVSGVCAGFRGGSFEYAYSRVARSVRFDLFAALVRQDVAFYDAHKTGEIASRLASDCQTMSDTVAMNVNVFLRNVVCLVGSMLFMMTLSWRLSLITFILVPIIFVASKIFGTYYDYLSEKTQNAVAHSNDVAEEVISTMRTVRSFACEAFEGDRFYAKVTDTLNVTKTKAFAYVGFIWVSELFQTFIVVAVLWYGGHLVLVGRLKADLLVSFLLYQMQMADNLRQMGEVWTGLMQSVGASRKVFEYIDREPTIQHHGKLQPAVLRGKIEFKNVHFAYPTRPQLPILRDLSFTAEIGQTVALVGPSGSGKSSCIALLENFYLPNAGQILIDGVPMDEYEHHYYHKKIALVGQEPVLFARSVSENIAYGVEVTEQDVVTSSQMANAHGFIVQTTMKYETNVGEKGSQMSGGQKQRIAIARALVRQPAILLLDEATSALDTESEAVVQEAISKNLEGKTVIMIAHRLSTVEKADKIIVINKGVVEQQGTHEELLRQPGTYATLVQRQMLGEHKGTHPRAVTQDKMLDGDDTLTLSDEEHHDIPPASSNGTSSKVNDLLLEDGEDVNLHSDAPASKLRLDEEPDEKPRSAAVLSTSNLDVSHSSPVAPRVEEHKNYVLKISIETFEKRGDGINAYLVYKVVTESRNNPGISDRIHEVWRRFSDFLGLHEKLVEKFLHKGVVVPYPPEKSITAMTKTKSGNSDHAISNPVGMQRARQLERFLRRIGQHQKMRTDCDVRDFLTMEAELPKASNTVALSSAGVKRLMKSVGEAFSKMAFHMEEGDRWFEQTQSHVEELEECLRKLLTLADTLQHQRKELSYANESMSKTISMLASCEESTALARALSHLTEAEESCAAAFGRQAENDQAKLTEAVGEYVALFQSLKDVFNERIRVWQSWQTAQQNLAKKREQKSRYELSGKMDRAQQAKDEMDETERKVDQLEGEFGEISRLIREEMGRFDAQRREDMREIFIGFLEALLVEQQELLKFWERFGPETQSIIL